MSSIETLQKQRGIVARSGRMPACAVLSVLATAVALLAVTAPYLASAQGPTPLPVPCSSAATRALSDACLLNLTYAYMAYEETGQWEAMLNASSADAYEFYAPTLLGGKANLPASSDQSLYYMNDKIQFAGDTPSGFTYLPVSGSIGADTVVFEYIARFNHTANFWLVPYPATGRPVSVVMVLSIGFDADNKVAYERVYYDGASVLVQVGALADGYGAYRNDQNVSCGPAADDQACNCTLPVVGGQAATLLLDGVHNSAVVFNGFYAREHALNAPTPSASFSHVTETTRKRTLARGRASHANDEPSGVAYTSRSSMIAARLDEIRA
nr:nuclear transport factor 2 like domain [Pandoravirus massiliensis]